MNGGGGFLGAHAGLFDGSERFEHIQDLMNKNGTENIEKLCDLSFMTTTMLAFLAVKVVFGIQANHGGAN